MDPLWLLLLSSLLSFLYFNLDIRKCYCSVIRDNFNYACGTSAERRCNYLGLISPPFLSLVLLFLSSLVFTRISPVSSFLCLFPGVERAEVKQRASVSLQAHPEPPSHAHSLSLTPFQPSLSHPSPWNPLTHLRQQAVGVLLGCHFSELLYFFLL